MGDFLFERLRTQGRIQPVSLGAISVIFSSQISFAGSLAYCKRDEVYFTILLWQNNGRQNGVSRMLFSELYKIMVNKVTLVGFRGVDRPPGSAPVRTCIAWMDPKLITTGQCVVIPKPAQKKFYFQIIVPRDSGHAIIHKTFVEEIGWQHSIGNTKIRLFRRYDFKSVYEVNINETNLGINAPKIFLKSSNTSTFNHDFGHQLPVTYLWFKRSVCKIRLYGVFRLHLFCTDSHESLGSFHYAVAIAIVKFHLLKTYVQTVGRRSELFHLGAGIPLDPEQLQQIYCDNHTGTTERQGGVKKLKAPLRNGHWKCLFSCILAFMDMKGHFADVITVSAQNRPVDSRSLETDHDHNRQLS